MRTYALCLAAALGISSLPAQAAEPIEAPTLAEAVDLGRSTVARLVNISIMLSYRDQAGLERLVAEQSDSASPNYHQFLSTAEFNARFAPTRQDYDRVVASVRRAGLVVTQTSENRLVVHVRGNAPAVARYFATDMHEVTVGGQSHYAHTRPATVPAEIADVVSGVAGLTDLSGFHTMLATPPTGTRVQRPDSAYTGPDGGIAPFEFARVYNLLSRRGFTGAGHAAAIIIDGDYLDSDVASFLRQFGIVRKGTIRRRLVSGGPGFTSSSVETTLDVEQIASLAPGSDVYVYEGINFANPANLIDTYNAVLQDNKVDTVNASLGYCEIGLGPIPKMIEQLALQGAALGITFHASSGDNGSIASYGCTGVSVNVPAAAPHVTAIGGTSLILDVMTGALVAEIGWTNARNTNLGASGGGVSSAFRLPAFQIGVPGVIARGRNVPDVSFDSDPRSGASFFYSGNFQGPIGGTSLASPIFSAAILQLNQRSRSRAGYVTPALYAAWRKNGYAQGATVYLRDLVAGSDGPGIGGGYNMRDGFDQVTGIGAPSVGNLATILK